MPSRLGRAAPRLRYGGDTDKTRTGAQPWRAWYKTSRWQRLRISVFTRDGYVCQRTGVLLTGKHPAPDSPVADHKRPHRGDPALFWEIDNIETVSKAYHDGAKQAQEKRGAVGGD